MSSSRILGLGLVVSVLAGVAVAFAAARYVGLEFGSTQSEAIFQGKPSSYWAKALRGDTTIQKDGKKQDPGKMLREGGAEALPVVLELMEGKDDETRQYAAMALATMKPEDQKQATPQLLAALPRFVESICFSKAAEICLQNDRPGTIRAYKETIERSPTLAHRTWTIVALADMPEGKEAIEVFRKALEAPEPSVRARAGEALQKLTGQIDVKVLLTLAEDPQAQRRAREQAKGLVPELLKCLKDPSADTRARAAMVLAPLVASDPIAAVPALADALKDTEAAVRLNSAMALGSLQAQAAPAVPGLMALMKDPDPAVRRGAASALGKIGEPAKEAVPLLLAALKDKGDDELPTVAAQALGSFGEASKEAVPILGEMLKDPESARVVASTLARFGAEAVPALREGLKSDDVMVRRYTLSAIAKLGDEAKPLLPDLLQATKTSSARARLDTLTAALALKPDAAALKPVLAEMAKDEDEKVRAKAAETLKKLE